MQKKYLNKVYIYIGPTLYGLSSFLDSANSNNIVWLPPVKRNDIEKLTNEEFKGTIVIADGNFHSCLAVGHKEIREAINAGWNVWGICSMGAIRAAEMHCLGMRGYGSVYENFLTNPDFSDDEVALLHEISDPYTPISEPLVNIRYALRRFVLDGLIGFYDEVEIVEKLKRLWYGERTLFLLANLLRKQARKYKDIARFIGEFDLYRIKSIDFLNFYNKKIWET